MGMVSTTKISTHCFVYVGLWIFRCVCVCVKCYLQTDTVAFINAPLSGPLSHEQAYRTQTPRRWKNPMLLGQEVQKLQWWGHPFTPGLGWRLETDQRPQSWRTQAHPSDVKKTSFGGLHAITCTAVMENKHKPFVFHLRKNYFCSPTHTHSETRTRAPLTHIERTAAVSVEQRTVSLALRSTSPWQHFLLRRLCSWTTYTRTNAV